LKLVAQPTHLAENGGEMSWFEHATNITPKLRLQQISKLRLIVFLFRSSHNIQSFSSIFLWLYWQPGLQPLWSRWCERRLFLLVKPKVSRCAMAFISAVVKAPSGQSSLITLLVKN